MDVVAKSSGLKSSEGRVGCVCHGPLLMNTHHRLPSTRGTWKLDIVVCIALGGVREFPKPPATTPARPLTPHHRPQTMSKKSKPADPTPPSVLEHRRSWSIRLYFDIKTGADVNAGVHHCLSCLVSMGRRTPTRCCVQNLVAFNGVLSSTIRIK